MRINKRIANLIAQLEYEIGSQCYNPNSYDGYTGEEGCEFRYPVYVHQNDTDEKYRYIITNLTPKEINTIKYKFGSNHLFIGKGLINVLKYLEDRYDIDFNELESKVKK